MVHLDTRVCFAVNFWEYGVLIMLRDPPFAWEPGVRVVSEQLIFAAVSLFHMSQIREHQSLSYHIAKP